MKIYLGSSVFDEQLTNVGSKHRLLSYFKLKDEKEIEEQLTLHRETGKRRSKGEGLEERKKRLEQGIDPSWDEKKQEAIKLIAYSIQDAFDNIGNKQNVKDSYFVSYTDIPKCSKIFLPKIIESFNPTI